MLKIFVFFVFKSNLNIIFFFVSSRRRHTRSDRDWSSDMCSSDLAFSIELATLIVELASSSQMGRSDVEHALRSGTARDTLRRMIEAQGGDSSAFDDRSRLPQSTLHHPVLAESDGYVSQLDALTVARASILLGAGRERKGDPIDLAVGVRLEAKIGDRIGRGQPIAVLHANDESRLVEAERVLRGGIELSTAPVSPPPVILERLGA